jgi:hypothetical protein
MHLFPEPPQLPRPADVGALPTLGRLSLYQPAHGGWPIGVVCQPHETVFCYDRKPELCPCLLDAALQIPLPAAEADAALQALAFLIAVLHYTGSETATVRTGGWLQCYIRPQASLSR